MTNTVTIGTALAFLSRHPGHPAFITADGLVVKGEVCLPDRTTQYQDDQDDNWFEELQVFPMHNNTVDLAPIKAWLGY